MRNIQDLSYSNIVNLVQKDENKGANLLVDFAVEVERIEITVKEQEEALKQLKLRKHQLITGQSYVIKHLNKEKPLRVIKKNLIVCIQGNESIIERNILRSSELFAFSF